ncbi:uncharacterized protein PFL1_00229 [Pseudozyma flocculosa PF-1]|uniref:uncharacterized protein n=1 Tax=Pseudozyma flocculosa PF-1 TaxID=1277687 RepID=UPI0004561000|nr:uncharacterized protein PFL1_00229 [Pseudozyma flocculosa PF-1]EPQ32031.1 hypothetical protein PFL1_00229 [Pseudozyma flocculosa PF-1]
MSELFDSLNFPSTGITSSQSSQPSTSRVYWHASPSPAFLSTRTGTPSKARGEHKSPTIPPLCTQAFLGELRKVSAAATSSHASSSRPTLVVGSRYDPALGSPVSPKARGKRRADPEALTIDDDGSSDEDGDGGSARGNRLFLGEIDESSPETRRRRTMDAGHTGRLRKSPLSSADAASQSQHARQGGESLDSARRADGGRANGNADDAIGRGAQDRRSEPARDGSSSSASARRQHRRSRGSSKRHNPSVWVQGLGITRSDSPRSLLALPLAGGALDESMDGPVAPQTARKLFEDLNAVLDESCNAIVQPRAARPPRDEAESAASQSCSAPLAVGIGAVEHASKDVVDIGRPHNGEDPHAQPQGANRTGFARSTSLPDRTQAAIDSRTTHAVARRPGGEGDSSSSLPTTFGPRRVLSAVKSHSDVFASDYSDAAHEERRRQVSEFAAAAIAPVARSMDPAAPRPLSSRSNLPPRAPSIPPKAYAKTGLGVTKEAAAVEPPPGPARGDARNDSRRKLGTRPPAVQPQQPILPSTTIDREPGNVDARTAATEIVDLTMDDEFPDVDSASSRSTSPRKSHTPSPTKQRQSSVASTTTAPGRSRSTGSTTRTALGMGKISSACLSQARQPGLPRSSQSVLGSQRPKRAVTAAATSSVAGRVLQAPSRSSPSAPFRPPAKTRLQTAAAAAAAASSTTSSTGASRTPSRGSDATLQPRTKPPQPPPAPAASKAHIGSDDSFGLSDTDDAAFASLASELGF